MNIMNLPNSKAQKRLMCGLIVVAVLKAASHARLTTEKIVKQRELRCCKGIQSVKRRPSRSLQRPKIKSMRMMPGRVDNSELKNTMPLNYVYLAVHGPLMMAKKLDLHQ